MRRNIISVIALSLFAYFSYNVLCGQRSVFRLYTLNREIAAANDAYVAAHRNRVALQSNVVRLRPATLDRDFLEERSRAVLGFGYAGERILLTAETPGSDHTHLN